MLHKHKFKLDAPGDYYKVCSCGKKKKAAKSVLKIRRRLKRKAEDLWREATYLRDGRICQIQKNYNYNLPHSDQMQIDHFFPRGDKNLFFDTSNATVICSTCNYLKSNGSSNSTMIQILLLEIVKKREGEEKFAQMIMTNQAKVPNRNFAKAWYLEEVIKKLQKEIDDLKARQMAEAFKPLETLKQI